MPVKKKANVKATVMDMGTELKNYGRNMWLAGLGVVAVVDEEARGVFDQLVNVMWRLRRLPQAQAHLFEPELDKAAEGEELSPAQVIARRFSDDPSNGFILLGRYERALQATMLRLLRQYDALAERSQSNPKQNPVSASELAISLPSGTRNFAERSQRAT